LIRTPVEQIRQAGRSTAGVWVLRTAEGESVVSVERLVEQDEDDLEEGNDPAAPEPDDG
ncbi:MAG: DNA gyrase C-terminal beta-propeller domain-containing protein, partial [Pseudomonadota bacterium]